MIYRRPLILLNGETREFLCQSKSDATTRPSMETRGSLLKRAISYAKWTTTTRKYIATKGAVDWETSLSKSGQTRRTSQTRQTNIESRTRID